MRTITANAQALLDQAMGTEIMVVLEVEWSDGGTVLYSDQEVEGAQAKILSMGGFDTSMILEGSSDSQELSVVLDDTDESIRNIYNRLDIHKRPARLYMLHKGLPEWDKILVFKGEVVTPITWDETQRTVSFNVLSKLDAKQTGFSMEEGDFPNIPDEALGKAWPLVFGQVCHLPAVKVRAPRRGYLQGGVGIKDFTLEPRLCQASRIQCPSNQTGKQTFREQGADDMWTSCTEDTFGPDLECVNRRFGEICRLKDLKEQQEAYEYDTLSIYNGVSFPQGERLTIFVDNATFNGTFTGNSFSIYSRTHPESANFNHVACRAVPDMHYGTVKGKPQAYSSPFAATDGTHIDGVGGYFRYVTITTGGFMGGTKYAHDVDGKKILGAWVPDETATYFKPENQSQAQAMQSCDEALRDTPGMVGGPKDSWAYYDEMEESSFFWAPSGTEVYMESESEILYIASLLPGTVDGVAAFRTAPNGFKYLTEVPTSYYTVYETDYQGYQVVEIGMNKALPLYNDQWEDQIYVSFTSSVGPNPCDIIEWLVGKYTNLTVDAASFATVYADLVNYPNNFYLTTRPDVYDLIQDIAYQSRCSVYVRNDVVYIKYLSKEPTSERTIDESEILTKTFVEDLTETEDVYTTHNIQWRTGGASVSSEIENERKLILKYNVEKYGTVEEDWDYYTYNIYDLILKSATFWLIRKANSWKRVKFETTIKHMDLDVGDCVTLNVAQFGGAVKVVIESMQLNPDNYTVAFTCWTPIRSGESSAYYWAWPSQQSIHAVWPLAGDNNGGGGYDFTVTPPVDHLLRGGAHRDDQLIISSGDLHPSDLDDIIPILECKLSDYLNFDDKPPEIIAKEIAQSAARANIENNMSGGGNPTGASHNKEEIEECGVTGAGCNYKVTITWHQSHAQGKALFAVGGPSTETNGVCGGPCGCGGGCPSCFGATWKVCHSFGSPWSASAFASYMISSYGKSSSKSYWKCMESGVLSAYATNGTHTGPTAGNCTSVATANSTPVPDTQQMEEIANPTGTTGAEPIDEYGDYDNWEQLT